ncbi:hypothetical protein A3J56_01930 [Candidatus Giovannonibacteria bacterium RIFCSPHIGHO2_02_FULL_46_20]|uniref:Uncharacterized protein n=1 Tax=Candidatus Giovannonibacteria bacterium RIFCSPHIGHO2_02_FULL_46_20 TaxID=1798338 RepID=A0A1F5WD97_9BACT|nr:MAG: hypothetical protein A3J56_01930 [Candidatus Giovannonibacteria bacterium RIFCSPHIGHO2_02_FULL_46_20]
MEEKDRFPHASDVLEPVARFFIGHRWLNLYRNTGRMQSASYILYWQDEINPVERGTNFFEVLNVLAHILTPERAREYVTLRRSLRNILGTCGVPSNPAASDEWIVNAIAQFIKQRTPNFLNLFHEAWGDDRGDGERRSDYDKEAWMYVQAKLEVYFSRRKRE